ncbi:MAG TPA: acetamidase/formamidase family protein, partial [Chitinophagaceae bacterium]
LTGPFFVRNSKPGDVLKITLIKVALNRDYAYTSESFVSRSMPDTIASRFRRPHLVKWKFDERRQSARPDSSTTPYPHLSGYSIPLHPFVGCIGVAPANRKNEKLSFFQGNFGGNMDFEMVAQGAIVFVPVLHDGAYFFIGDGHAEQGDGEIAGNALETSLDVTFTIDVIREQPLQWPRVEYLEHIYAIGAAATLDKAVKIATSNLLSWLQATYSMSAEEATQVMSTAIEYKIAEIADPDVIVVASIDKRLLGRIAPVKPGPTY